MTAAFVGVNRRGRSVVGQLGPRVDLGAWVEGRYRARWRRLEVVTGDTVVGAIYRNDDTGRRVWWAELPMVDVPELPAASPPVAEPEAPQVADSAPMSTAPRLPLLLALVAALVALATGCQPATPPPAPRAATVDIYGDSVTFQAAWGQPFAAGAPAGDQLRTSAWLGWTYTNVQADATDRAAQGYAEVVVIALGTNNARDGWQPADALELHQLVATFHPATCVVLVGPAVVPERTAARWPAMALGIYGADLAMEREARARPGTIVAPWWATVQADPSLLQSDGIHLAIDPATELATPAAASAWARTMWAAVARCP